MGIVAVAAFAALELCRAAVEADRSLGAPPCVPCGGVAVGIELRAIRSQQGSRSRILFVPNPGSALLPRGDRRRFTEGAGLKKGEKRHRKAAFLEAEPRATRLPRAFRRGLTE
jgi:hypothetical protein